MEGAIVRSRSSLAEGGGHAAACPPLLIAEPQEGNDLVDDGDLELSQDEFLALDGNDAASLVVRRFEALRERGCEPEAAVVVAVHPDVSITDAAELLAEGCDPRTVVRILR
jgi:hypothetical protein